MKKLKGRFSVKVMIYRLITIIVVLCLMLLTFEVITYNKDGRRQIIDEDGGVEVSVLNNLSMDEENGGAIL